LVEVASIVGHVVAVVAGFSFVDVFVQEEAELSDG
jgi:ribosomal protein S19